MHLSDIHLRDPFVLPVASEQTYYLYGTEGKTAWKGNPGGFFVYRSRDLESWDGPEQCFAPPADFWSDHNYWAPEVHGFRGRYYLFATFKAEGRRRGTQVLRADRPAGPFAPVSAGPLTPSDWECLDGTLFVDDDQRPWMVFCHEWVQVGDGEICAVRLSDELDRPVGEPQLLFRSSEAPWSRRIRGGDNWVTDGPFLYRPSDGGLLMIWSGFGDGGYTLGIARSESGSIHGPWRQEPEPLFRRDGGHGMLFRDFSGDLLLTVHSPNAHPDERPFFYRVEEHSGTLFVTGPRA